MEICLKMIGLMQTQFWEKANYSESPWLIYPHFRVITLPSCDFGFFKMWKGHSNCPRISALLAWW